MMWTASLVFLVLGCGGAPDPGAEGPHAHDRAPSEIHESRQPRERVSISALVLSYDGLDYAGLGPRPKRTKEEAAAMAERLVAEARKDPGRFADLAREHSDHPSSREGGRMPSWESEETHGPLAQITQLEIGEVSDPIDWSFGYLIVKREPVLVREPLSARRLVVAWKGAQRAPEGVERTKEAARERAVRLREAALENPEGFEQMVREESDGFDRDRGGYLGTWKVETKRVPVHYEAAITELEIGGISEPVESDIGFELFQRLEPQAKPRQLAASHVLVSWKGAEDSRSTRSRAEAEALAADLLAQATAAPQKFSALAGTHSDDATAKTGGGLGAWRVGSRMPEAFDEALLALEVGQVGVVETPFGFHVVLREKAPADRGREYRTPGEEAQYYE